MSADTVLQWKEHVSLRGFSAQNKAEDEAGLAPGEDDNAVMHRKGRRARVNSIEDQYKFYPFGSFHRNGQGSGEEADSHSKE